MEDSEKDIISLKEKFDAFDEKIDAIASSVIEKIIS